MKLEYWVGGALEICEANPSQAAKDGHPAV